MKKLFPSVALVLAFIGASLGQAEPQLHRPWPSIAPSLPNPNVCWSEPPDLEGWILTSEVIGDFGLESEVANDFVLDEASTIVRARWWGGYYGNTNPCDPGMAAPGFRLRFYEDLEDCLPTPGYPLAEFVVEGTANETYVGCQQEEFPLFAYEAELNLPVTGGVRVWFSVQIADHGYPPQWGRLATVEISGCESAFRAGWWWWGWDPVGQVIGYSTDFSQEFDCETAVAVEECSWGRIKRLYR